MFQRLNHWLEACSGYRVSKGRQSSIPKDTVDDPRLVAYHDPGAGNGCAIFAPIEFGLGFNAFVLGPKSYHPWIVAARAAGKDNDRRVISSILDTYYSIVRPEVLSDWLDIPKFSCPRVNELPLHAWSVVPWSITSPIEVIKRIEIAQLVENRSYGLDAGMLAGAKAFGPVSNDKLRIEAERIGSLFESIKQYGLDHQRSDYNLRATFLVSGHRWSWLSMGGMHRVAMAAASGVTQIPVRVAAVVRRDEVDIWPQVVSGLYDKDMALNLFDRLIDLRPPKCVLPWIDWVDDCQLSLGEP